MSVPTKSRIGRKPLPVGQRYDDGHTVAIKLPPAEWQKLQEVAALKGLRAGRYSTDFIIEHLRSLDLETLRTQGGQEAFDVKAS